MKPSRRGGLRFLVLIAAAVAITASTASTAVAAAPPKADPAAPVTVDLRPRQLTEHVWWVEGQQGQVSLENEGFNSNAGFVITSEGVVVFDTLGTPALGAALLAEIRKISDQPVRRVILSHYHSDHFYGVQAFKDAGAEVWAQELVRDYLASKAPAERLAERRQSLAPWVTSSARIVAPDHFVDGNTQFRLGQFTFRLYHAGPAHSPEDLMMLVQEEGVLFAGDLIFAGRVPFVGTADSRSWLAALDKLAEFHPRFVVTGHGPASTDAEADIKLTRDYLLYLRQEMGKAVDDFASFDEAYSRTDWSRFSSLPAFEAANRRNAYNTFLLMERESLSEER